MAKVHELKFQLDHDRLVRGRARAANIQKDFNRSF